MAWYSCSVSQNGTHIVDGRCHQLLLTDETTACSYCNLDATASLIGVNVNIIAGYCRPIIGNSMLEIKSNSHRDCAATRSDWSGRDISFSRHRGYTLLLMSIAAISEIIQSKEEYKNATKYPTNHENYIRAIIITMYLASTVQILVTYTAQFLRYKSLGLKQKVVFELCASDSAFADNCVCL